MRPRKLPIVELDGRQYYADEESYTLRDAEDPLDRRVFHPDAFKFLMETCRIFGVVKETTDE